VNRTSLATGVIIPALVAVLPGCDDPFTCPGSFDQCSAGVCIDISTNDEHCGACGNICDNDEHCEAGSCVADLVCNAPEMNCGNECVNTQISAEHCGACDDPCPGNFDDCVAGECATPLVAMTTYNEPSTGVMIGRDLHVLRDLTYALTKINDTTFASPRVVDYAVLPDGNLLMVAATADGVYGLWMASPRGGPLTRVSGAMPIDRDVEPGIAVSRDGSKVLYRADADTDGVLELYAASIAAPGTAVKVNGALVSGGQVSRVFALSADGRRATYIADADMSGHNELYTVDLSGATPGSPVQLNAATSDPIWDFQMTPDGARVVYRVDNRTSNDLELHVVNVATPASREVVAYADNTGSSPHVVGYQLSRDGGRLAFSAGGQYLEESLWYVDLTQAPPYVGTRLADGTTSNEWVTSDLAFTPDGSRVVFLQRNTVERLFVVAVDSPGGRVRLSAAGDTSAEQVGDFVLSADGTHAVYRGGADGVEGGDTRRGTDDPGFNESYAPALYAVDLTAATPTPELLSAPPILGHDGVAGGYIVTRDNRRVVYRADDDVMSQLDAYLISIGTTDAARKVSPPLDQPSDASDVWSVTRF
jgi:Tol biopolymer transport system component